MVSSSAEDLAVTSSLVATAGSVPVLLAAAPAAAQYYGYGHHDGWFDGSWGWGHMIFGSILWIVVIALVVVAVVALVRWSAGASRAAGGPGRSALDILNDRYARGEIDTAEYDERKRTLGG